MKEQRHREMVKVLWRDTEILRTALNLPRVWVRAMEYQFQSGEAADLVFQDRFNASSGDPEATCYVVELKSRKADHELVGQLRKYINILRRIGKSTSQYGNVVGIAIAPEYSQSALKMLWEDGVRVLIWQETMSGIKLREVPKPGVPKKAMPPALLQKLKDSVRKNP